MVQARAEFGIALLANGQVLVVGGRTAYDANGCLAVTAKAEIYNPATGTWTATGAMRGARHEMNATRLASGKVLVVGGATASMDALNSTEIYDPTAKTFTLGLKMVQARSDYASIMLATGIDFCLRAERTSMASALACRVVQPFHRDVRGDRQYDGHARGTRRRTARQWQCTRLRWKQEDLNRANPTRQRRTL